MLVSLPSSTAWLAGCRSTGNNAGCHKKRRGHAVDQNYILLDTRFPLAQIMARNLWLSVGRHGRHRDAIVGYTDIAWFAADFDAGTVMRSSNVSVRRLTGGCDITPRRDCSRRGCIDGGVVRTEQVSELLIRELQAGVLVKYPLRRQM